jgi:hypothetical protein
MCQEGLETWVELLKSPLPPFTKGGETGSQLFRNSPPLQKGEKYDRTFSGTPPLYKMGRNMIAAFQELPPFTKGGEI